LYIRVRQFVAPAVLLLPAVLLCGKLLFTPVIEVDRHRSSQVRGWPWVVWESYEVRTGNISTTFSTFFPWQLAADTAVLLGILSACGGLLAWHRWRNQGWFCFSLRGLMGMTAFVAAGVGWWTNQKYQWQQEQQTLQRFDSTISVSETKYLEQQWLRRIWPHQDFPFFRRVTWIRVGGDPSRIDDEALMAISQLKRLRVLEISDCPVTDVGVAYLSRCSDLECLNLSGTRITDAGVIYLSGLSDLCRLNLSGTVISDTAIDTITRLDALQDVDISFCRSITDRGVRRLLDLPRLTNALMPELPQISYDAYRLVKNTLYERLLEN